MKLKLHNYRRCPFCIRVRIWLEVYNVAYEVIEERLGNWTDRIADLPDPCVPILDIDGKLMRESRDIMVFVEREFGNGGMSGDTDDFWFDWCDRDLKPAIDHFKYSNPERNYNREESAVGAERVRDCLKLLESKLSEMPKLGGESWGLADAAIIPFVRQIRQTRGGEFDFGDFPLVYAWMMEMLEADFFANRVMKKWPFAKAKLVK